MASFVHDSDFNGSTDAVEGVIQAVDKSSQESAGSSGSEMTVVTTQSKNARTQFGEFLEQMTMRHFLEDLRAGFVMSYVADDDYVCQGALATVNASTSSGAKNAYVLRSKSKVNRRKDSAQKVKVTNCYPLNTEKYEVGQLAVPVLASVQDHLVGSCIEDFSDSEEVDGADNKPVWSRVSCKLQMEIPMLDMACATKEPHFDEVIGIAGCTIYHSDIDLAAEVTIFVHKRLGSQRNSIKAELSDNPYDIATYNEKFKSNYEVLSDVWQCYDVKKNDPYYNKPETRITLNEEQMATQEERRATMKDKFSEVHPTGTVVCRAPVMGTSAYHNEYNDPFIRDRQGVILSSLVNGWRRDLLPGPCISMRDAVALACKYQNEAIDIIKSHTSKTLTNVVPYQWLKYVTKQMWDNLINEFNHLGISAPSVSLTLGIQAPSMQTQLQRNNYKDKFFTYATASAAHVVSIDDDLFAPTDGLRSVATQYAINGAGCAAKDELVECMRASGYKFCKNKFTEGPELIRGQYKYCSTYKLRGLNHALKIMPKTHRVSTYLSRLEFTPPLHLATNSVSDVYHEMQKLMYLHTKYINRPHVLIHVELKDEEFCHDVDDDKLYMTHQFAGLVGVVWAEKKVKLDLLVEIRTNTASSGLTHLRTTPLRPEQIGVLLKKM